jgi:chemotaxis protein methyltransferase CheR
MNGSRHDFLSVFLLQSRDFAAGAGREYVIEARLEPLAPSWGFLGIPQLERRVQSGRDSRLATAIVQALNVRGTTRNKTGDDATSC